MVISQTTSTLGPPSLAAFRSEMSVEDLKEGFELSKEGVECCSALLQSTLISLKDALLALKSAPPIPIWQSVERLIGLVNDSLL